MQKKGLLGQLINDLCSLPGIGQKSAQRMAFHLLQNDRTSARRLAETLKAACEKIGYCSYCRTLTEQEVCETCADPTRDQTSICIVESPADAWAVTQSTAFNGLFFVLHGHLSPLDGVGPEELGIGHLENRFKEGVTEIILATNSTVEGEATAFYIADMAKRYGVNASRIAHGVPMGGELEYIDSGTLEHAFNGRREI